jgi:hypothetical protein
MAVAQRIRGWDDDRLLLIICSSAFVVRLRFKESLTSTCRSRTIPLAEI